MVRIYVGNLAFRSKDSDIHKAFSKYGEVAKASVAIDPATGRSAGFAFVEMPNDSEARAAIAGLHNKEINSRVVTVSEAVPEPEKPRYEKPRYDRRR